MRPRLGVRDSITVMPHRKDARVILEALLAEDVERPERATGNRVGCRTVTQHRFLGQILEQRLSGPSFALELRRSLRVDQAVAHSVRCDLMAGRRNLAHDLRML